MKIKMSVSFAVAFMALRYSMHELHELVHTAVGRMICGCWGQRDFNTWSLCPGCSENNSMAILATFSGPLFTYLSIWTGVYFLNSKKNLRQKSFGFALIFSNNPFARIFTAAIGKGDEVSGLKYLMHHDSLAWATGVLIVLIFTIYPLVNAFKTIQNKNRFAWFIIFLLAPMVLDVAIIFGLMNSLLKSGFLCSYWILGSPVIITSYTFLMLILLIVMRKKIFNLAT